MKIYSKGNELKREVLSSMDVVVICENGVEMMVKPRLEGGEEVEEEKQDDDNELPDIKLLSIADPRMQKNFWMQDVVHKELGETEGHVHSVIIR